MSNVFCIGNGTSRKNFNLEKIRPYGKIFGCNAIYRTFTPDVLVSVDHGIMHEIYHSGYCKKNETWFRDWTKCPDFMYDSLVHAGLSKIDIDEINKWHVKNENKRSDEKEFVMHGANLSGLITILNKDKSKFQKNINSNQLVISWVRDTDKTHDLKEIMVNQQGSAIDHGWSAGPTSGYIAIKLFSPKKVYLIGHDLYSNNDKVNNMYAGTKHYTIPEHSPTPCVNWIEQWKTLFTWEPKIQFIKVNEFNDDRDTTNTAINEWHGKPNIRYINFQQLDKELGL